MKNNGQHETHAHDGVLRWPGRVVATAELRRHLNGHRTLLLPPRTVITPLAVDELRTQGIRLLQENEKSQLPATGLWICGQDRAFPAVQTAVRALQREGLSLYELSAAGLPAVWARAVAEQVARGDYAGGVLFCDNPGLMCCVANKIAGLRAAAVTTIAQASQALHTLAPNLVAVEMPGRTYFEIRQILQVFCQVPPRCPESAADTLRELDGHAHR